MGQVRSSHLFNALKATQETLDKNYSTYQLLTILDDLLYRAVYEVIRSSTYMDYVFATILTWYYGEGRRKISPLKKDRLVTLIFVFLYADSPEEKLRVLRKMEIERNILADACRIFIRRSKVYRS